MSNKENALFILPDTMEEALWTVPPLSQYLENRLVMTKPIRDNVSGYTVPARYMLDRVSIVCPLAELHSFVESCWNEIEVTCQVTDEQKERADLIIEFNPKTAYELTKRNQKHITEAYGVQLGAIPMMMLPAVAQRVVREEPGSVLVVRRHHSDEKRDWVWEHEAEFIQMGVENGLSVKAIFEKVSYEELAKAVSRASVIVGVRGTGTLLATSFRKVVMELSPDEFEHKHWMSKWESKTYRMIYGALSDMTAWFVWDRTNKLVTEISKMRGPDLWTDHQLTTSAEVSAIAEG